MNEDAELKSINILREINLSPEKGKKLLMNLD